MNKTPKCNILTLFKFADDIEKSNLMLDRILDRFEKDETFLNKDGVRVTCRFRQSLREMIGLNPDYTSLTRREKIEEARIRILRDFRVARIEIKSRDPIDYLLDRALDPLDPMNTVYKFILVELGAKVDFLSNRITFAPGWKLLDYRSILTLLHLFK